MAATPSPRAIGYARVSTDKQADRGVSLDVQAERIRAMAVVQGAQLVDLVIDEGASAKSLQRTGLARLLATVDAGAVDVVIVAKLDRLTRSVRDLADLLDRFARRRVALVSVGESLDTGTAAGRLVLNVMTSVAQWEREAIGERTREALRHKRAIGQRAGNVPFGYGVGDDGHTLIPNPAERRILAQMRRLRRDGYTVRRIAEQLNARGFRTRRGTPWRFGHVAALLRAA